MSVIYWPMMFFSWIRDIFKPQQKETHLEQNGMALDNFFKNIEDKHEYWWKWR